MERWEKVTHISIGFAWTVAALFGIAGYSTFRALSQGKEGLIVNFQLGHLIAFSGENSISLLIIFRVFPAYIFMASPSAGDLLENYCWDDDLMNFSRVLFSISILLTFPIECFVSREVRTISHICRVSASLSSIHAVLELLSVILALYFASCWPFLLANFCATFI